MRFLRRLRPDCRNTLLIVASSNRHFVYVIVGSNPTPATNFSWERFSFIIPICHVTPCLKQGKWRRVLFVLSEKLLDQW